MAIDINNGKIYIAGSTDGNLVEQNFGGTDIFVAQYDFDGIQLWLKQYGTSQYDACFGIAISSKSNSIYT